MQAGLEGHIGNRCPIEARGTAGSRACLLNGEFAWSAAKPRSGAPPGAAEINLANADGGDSQRHAATGKGKASGNGKRGSWPRE